MSLKGGIINDSNAIYKYIKNQNFLAQCLDYIKTVWFLKSGLAVQKFVNV